MVGSVHRYCHLLISISFKHSIYKYYSYIKTNLALLPLKKTRENQNQVEKLIFFFLDTIAKKWRPQVLLWRTTFGRSFTTIVTDSISKLSPHMHVPSPGQEGFTQLLLRSLCNNLYNYLIKCVFF